MSSIVSACPIEKLTGRENYNSWKFAVCAYLECDDLWGCIEGTAEYVQNAQKERKARARIVLSLNKQLYSHVQNCDTAQETWKSLEKAFDDNGLTRKVGLLKTLTSTKLVDCKSVDEYVSQIITTTHRLKELKFEIQEEMVGALLLAGLPEEYKPMIMALENSGIPIRGDSVKVKLLQDVKLTEKAAGEDTALYSKAKSHKNK